MGAGGLSPLQRRVLEILADTEPPWTLTGGGALVGVHLHHRTTRGILRRYVGLGASRVAG